jgi:Acyl-CoA reductase (LuxC)
MNREQIIEILVRLGDYFRQDGAEWQEVKARAAGANPWFTPAHIDTAVNYIADRLLRRELLQPWAAAYPEAAGVRKVGIVMAANIPLVGFHDLLCGLMSGHELWLRTSARDEVLMKHVVHKLTEWAPTLSDKLQLAERLNGCDAYIATGSNNSARYFEEYFGKYPHLIRRNRTSVAVLDGSETPAELAALAEDVFLYFGMGCRNVTQLCVPRNYDFVALLDAFRVKNDYANFHKYKNNYDYHLAIYLLNRVPYMSNESLLMVENEIPFSAVSVLHYRYYDDLRLLRKELTGSADIQAVTGHDYLPFGTLQQPGLTDYADGVDTMTFLTGLGAESLTS